MNLIREAEVEVFADYHQFYVWDGGMAHVAPEDWSDEDVANRAKVAEHVLVVCPVRNMTVPVRISQHLHEPVFDLSNYDHVVRASVALPTGQLQLHECTGGEVLTWKVTPGTYCALVLFAGLGTLSSDGLEGKDVYQVALWPGERVPLQVVKKWSAA
jgi:hypothetical protein